LYIAERIEVPVYAGPALDGERVTVIHSADAVELLGRDGNAAQVRLADGTEGWVDDSLVTEDRPAAARVEALTAEIERLRAAARTASGSASDVKTLQATNAELTSALEQARAEVTRLRTAARAAPAQAAAEDLSLQQPPRQGTPTPWRIVLTVLAIGAALGLGFWWGYRTLEKRVLAKYGGLKVY
ncbi:MAG TPA: SH3 domain-containing protein, partial [Steroidobacteraceae bacterium]|nr:SH3 domain-containing protein [Steroidobacteraceae bacterium]